MKLLYKTSLLTLALSLLPACAENASSPVAPFSKNNSQQQEQNEDNHHSLLALKYSGRGGLGLSCNLYVTLHEGELLLKVDFTTSDGHSPSPGHGELFFYDPSSGNYYDLDSPQPNTHLSLSSILLKNKDLTPNPNSLRDYISQGLLEQSIRVEFKGEAEASLFTQALENVLTEPAQLPTLLPALDQVAALEMVLAHGDHYHSPTCRNYTLTSLEETDFESGHDHDHDDDHDDDHDHDH